MKLAFRKLKESDIPLLIEIRNECAEEFLHDSSIFTKEESLKWFKETKPDYYAITLDGKMIGYFRVANYSKKNGFLYLGADLHKDYRGQGLAYKSYLRFIPFLFEKYNLNKICMEVLTTNLRAFNLDTKLGFKIEGLKRQEIFKKTKFIDSIVMSMLKSEFKEIDWKKLSNEAEKKYTEEKYEPPVYQHNV